MSGRRYAQEDLQFRILRILQADPEISQRELARKSGVSLGMVNYCLDALIEKGLVKLGNFTASSDRRRYAYLLTPRGVARKAAMTHRFLKRKVSEYEMLRQEIESLREELSDSDGELSGAGDEMVLQNSATKSAR